MTLFNTFTLLLAVLVILYAGNAYAACGYKSCPATKPNMINIHLVPHSHDDVGWLKTVDQYYYGARNSIQHAGVQYILDNVVQELLKDSKRRFIYVESAFFYKWFSEQSTEMKKQVKKLVHDGRLEFAGGSWSMNDEAAVHYQSVIDQFTLGLKFLSDTFGTCGRPRVGWQIDPFGHSREMASLFAQMGYDGEFFARMDWVEKSLRLKNLTSEMIWKASDDLGERAELFTGLLYNHYSAPPGFCFDILCSDDPIVDGNSYDNNVKERVDTFMGYIKNVTKSYRSTHIMVPMGDDFNYENAEMNFKNMDKLIKYVNERQYQGSKINVFYSTPSCYLNAIHQLPLTWPNKTQDFFPYSTDWHTYWTGYYTSRPTQKRFEREANHFLQVVKQLTVLANVSGATATANLEKLRQVMGVMQHHDAITGTEKQRVAYDYDRLLTDALHSAEINTRLSLQKLTNLTNGEFVSCLQQNISVCEFTRNGANNLVVTLFNPLAHMSTQYVRVPVKNGIYEVRDASGRLIPSQLVPVTSEVLILPFRVNNTQHELVFQASVQKLANYYVRSRGKFRAYDMEEKFFHLHWPHWGNKKSEHKKVTTPKPANTGVNHPNQRAPGDIIVQNSLVKLIFNNTGHLTNIYVNGVQEKIRQDFYYYKGAAGNNGEFKNRSSGAYIFRPNGTEILIGPKVQLKIVEGPLVKEVHQRFNDWVSQVIRIYENEKRVEFEWLVGPIPIQDNIGKEVITRFTSNINNKGVFWTDSNGREMLRRVRNEREYFKPNMTEAVSGNYYPITARIAIESDNRRLAVLTDRAQGGSSLRNGEIELMLHRRLLHDDAFGVGEALNETAFGRGLVARGKVYLLLDTKAQKPSISERLAQQQIHLPFWKFYSSALKATNRVPPVIPNLSMLPLNVQMLTLEPFSENERLIRFENFMDHNESSTSHFSIRPIFDALKGEEIRETTLDGSMALSDMRRFKFHPDGKQPAKIEYYTSKHTPLAAKKKDNDSKFIISLDPMQIRTFIIKSK